MSNIEWTNETWNPIVGCSIVSAGCTNCYAMRMAARLEAMDAAGAKGLAHYRGTTQPSKAGPVWTGRIGIGDDDAFTKPLRWKKPRLIFVNSMADLFHPSIPDSIIDRVFAVMALCPQHTFQVLTKRAERMRAYFEHEWRWAMIEGATQALYASMHPGEDPSMWLAVHDLPNVWLGVSVENQAAADERIPHLLATPAAVRWISAEPLLGPVSLGHIKHPTRPGLYIDALDGFTWSPDGSIRLGEANNALDWVVVGGESGPGARDNDFMTNARSLRDQCASAGTPFFGKQGYKKAPLPDDLNIRQWPGDGE